MIQVEKFVPGGQALGTLNDPTSPHHGKKVFLWNALPGEIAESFDITKVKSSYLEAIATKIQRPSSHRVAPRDALYLSTSPWQILDWNYELAEKRTLVAESLAQAHVTLPENVSVEPVKTDGNQWRYRNKMEYALYWDNSDEQIYLAFRARGSHQKLPLKPAQPPAKIASKNPSDALEGPKRPQALSSSLERPEILQAALECVRGLNSRHEEARKYQSLLLRCSQSGAVSGGLFENKKPHPAFKNLSDSLLGHKYSYSPNGFFQINLPVYELALQEIQKHIKTAKVLDLYAGVGTIGLSVARDKDLTLIECDKSAYRELKNNAKNHQTILAKSEDCLTYIEPDQTVILDPPRAGCDQKLIARLLEVQPQTIIYLSCNPSTQARDVFALTEHGAYKITKVTPFNFFPKTPHIENLIVLKR